MRLPTYRNLPQAIIQGPMFGCPGVMTYLDARTRWLDEEVVAATRGGGGATQVGAWVSLGVWVSGMQGRGLDKEVLAAMQGVKGEERRWGRGLTGCGLTGCGLMGSNYNPSAPQNSNSPNPQPRVPGPPFTLVVVLLPRLRRFMPPHTPTTCIVLKV